VGTQNGSVKMLPGRERSQELVELGLRESTADSTEVLIRSELTELTRFTDLAIHQNVAERHCELFLRTIWGRRVVVVESGDVSPAGIRAALRRSQELAQVVAPSTNPPDFGATRAMGDRATGERPVTFNQATASCGPTERAAIVDRICGVFRRMGVNGAGNVRVQQFELAVGNSAGLRRYAPYSMIALVLTAFDRENLASGFQNWMGRDIERMDPEGLARQAAIKCMMGRRPKSLEARPMTAILEPAAVAQLLFHLNYRSLGVFGAQSAGLRQNIIFDNLGRKITGASISITDDPATEGFVPMPFDCEGVDRQRLELISKGIATGIVHDLTTAAAFGRPSTGHAQTPGDESGPLPQHLVMDGGSMPVSEMIETTEYGVLVSRIHGFVLPISGKQGALAGTTRDGLFLIEKGRITGPIRNFRWMEAVFSALDTVEGISPERTVQFQEEHLWLPAFVLAPTVKLGRFNFVDAQRWRA